MGAWCEKSEWFMLCDDAIATVKLEFFKGKFFLHAVVNGNAMEAVRRLREGFPRLKEKLREMGYAAVFVIIPDDDGKLLRFERGFGFIEVGRADGLIVMRHEF